MMKTKTFWSMICVLLTISILLTACGGENATTPIMSHESVAISDENAVKLTIWTDPIMAKVIRNNSAKFEKDYGANIVVEEFGFGAILTNFTVAAPAGEGPDIIVGAHDWLGELVSNGLLSPVELGDMAKDFSPAAINAFTYNDELYGMPYMTENVAFFRNTDLVPEAPATWDEVVEISRKLTADNTDNINANQYGMVLAGNDAYHFYPMMSAFGGYVFGQNEDSSYNPSDIGIGSEGSIKAAELFDSMIEENLIPPALDGQTVLDWIIQGKAAMTITGPWNLAAIRDSGIHYALDPIPSGTTEGRPFLGAGGFMINSFSKNQLLSQIFLTEFIATPEVMRSFYESEPRTPAFMPVLNNLDDPDIKSFARAGENALPMPSIPEMGSVWQSWINALTLIANQTVSPDWAFSTAAKQIETVIKNKEAAKNAPPESQTTPEPIVYTSVNIPGTQQTSLGCTGNWLPDCAATALTLGDDSLWHGTFKLSAGQYEVKVACNNGWDINFGFDGLKGGSNIVVTVAQDTDASFSFDPESGLLDITGEGITVSKGGGF